MSRVNDRGARFPTSSRQPVKLGGPVCTLHLRSSQDEVVSSGGHSTCSDVVLVLVELRDLLFVCEIPQLYGGVVGARHHLVPTCGEERSVHCSGMPFIVSQDCSTVHIEHLHLKERREMKQDISGEQPNG